MIKRFAIYKNNIELKFDFFNHRILMPQKRIELVTLFIFLSFFSTISLILDIFTSLFNPSFFLRKKQQKISLKALKMTPNSAMSYSS